MGIVVEKKFVSVERRTMRKKLVYDISDIEPYINWLYFFHAWGLDGKPQAEKDSMRLEAEKFLATWQGRCHTYAVFGIFDANSDGDDLLLGETRIPMLRQQKVLAEGEPHLCLADFVRPLSSGIKDCAGAFCTTVSADVTDDYKDDEYNRMLSQVLCDRLAEGTAEKMHEEVRRVYWGYAPDEHLTMQQTHAEEYQGIRPAVGYPSLPDTSVNFLLDRLLDMKQIGIRLTQSGMMIPHASVSGFMFSHPQSRYFDLGKIGEDQLRDYARRRGLPVNLIRKWLPVSL
jgi:cobalamin-dependent methionine synthase I